MGTPNFRTGPQQPRGVLAKHDSTCVCCGFDIVARRDRVEFLEDENAWVHVTGDCKDIPYFERAARDWEDR